MTEQAVETVEKSSVQDFFGEMVADPAEQLSSDSKMADELRGRQIAAVRKSTPLMMLVNAINIMVTVYALYSPENLITLSIWALAGALIIIMGMKSVGFRFKVKGEARPRKSTNRVVTNVVVLASLWAVLPVLFMQGASIEQQLFLICMCAGMMGGGTFAMAMIPRAATTFCVIVAIGGALHFRLCWAQ